MSVTPKLVIAIDGPAGSGKSTIAARVAKALGYVNLESGAMYRALALKALEQHVSPDDAAFLRQLALDTHIALKPAPEGNRVLLDGRDVTERIREADVTAAASRVSVHPGVREYLVFPNAEVKIFLNAAAGVRAERRMLQQGQRSGEETRRVAAELAARDERDRTRSASPLVAAPDAIHIDSTGKSIDEVVAEVKRVVREKLAVSG